jgi:hypothetical protein
MTIKNPGPGGIQIIAISPIVPSDAELLESARPIDKAVAAKDLYLNTLSALSTQLLIDLHWRYGLWRYLSKLRRLILPFSWFREFDSIFAFDYKFQGSGDAARFLEEVIGQSRIETPSVAPPRDSAPENKTLDQKKTKVAASHELRKIRKRVGSARQ